MTSKNLFFKLIKQDWKKRIWCPIIIFIVYFIAMDISLLMRLDTMRQYSDRYSYTSAIFLEHYFFGSGVEGAIVGGCLTAILCAVSGFCWLHSKTQVDAYNSMPVKRTLMFASKFLSGILQFLVPFMLNIAICLLIGAANGIFTMQALANAVCYAFYALLCFLAVYSVTVMAVSLTGNMIISLIAAGVLLSYSVIIFVIKENLFNEFFMTCISMGEQKVYSFSPLGLIGRLMNAVNGSKISYRTAEVSYKAFNYGALGGFVLPFILQAFNYGALSLLFYVKRPSEAAGRAIAFRRAEPVIKTLIVIPASLLIGLCFMEIIEGSFGWFVFGTFLCFVIMSAVMEIIFHFDIRAAFKNKRHMLFNAACTALIVIIFKYDVLGYDTYVPLDTQLEGCAVSIDGLLDCDYRDEDGHYTSAREYRLKNVNLKDNAAVMELARKAAAQKLQVKDSSDFDTYEMYEEYARDSEFHSIVLGYKLARGKTIYRQYIIDLNDADTHRLLSEVFADEDYKLGITPIFNEDISNVVGETYLSNLFYNMKLDLGEEEKRRQLIEAYRQDYMQLTLDDIMNTMPIGKLGFEIGMEHLVDVEYSWMTPYYEDEYRQNYPVYPQFTNTISLAKSYGFDYNKELDVENVEYIEVSGYKSTTHGDGADAQTDSFTITYTDKEQIRQISEALTDSSLAQWSHDYNSYIYNDKCSAIMIEYKHDNNDKVSFNYTSYYFIKDETPEFVVDDFK